MSHAKIEFTDYALVGTLSELTVAQTRVFTWLGPCFALLIFLGICVSVILSEDTTFEPMYRFLIIAAMSSLPGVLIWRAVRNGRFVLAANRNGIFYRFYDQPSRAVSIPWALVGNIFYRDGKADDPSEVVVEILTDVPNLPRPTNGVVSQVGSTCRISFVSGKSASALIKLNALKQRASEMGSE